MSKTVDGGKVETFKQMTSQAVTLTPITVPTAVEGQLYYDSGTNKLKFYNGSAWETVTSVQDEE